tara:strand:+ start:195 stop:722 length:528 start_codon:yes stop_codon:yes gene_type:complete
MKKIIILCFFAFSLFTQAQSFRGLDKSPLDMANFPASSQVQDKVLRVLYSRPQLKSRNLKTLIPNGKLWRTGANESTEIMFFKDVKIDSKTVPSGRYTLYTIPDKTTWIIILNKKVNTWGAYAYDSSQDLLRVKVPVEYSNENLEAFSITIKGKGSSAFLHMGWDNLRVKLPIDF